MSAVRTFVDTQTQAVVYSLLQKGYLREAAVLVLARGVHGKLDYEAAAEEIRNSCEKLGGDCRRLTLDGNTFSFDLQRVPLIRTRQYATLLQRDLASSKCCSYAVSSSGHEFSIKVSPRSKA